MQDDPDGLNVAIGEAVRRAIYGTGVSLRAATDRAGLSYRTVLRYITGERDLPVPVLIALADATGLDLVALVDQVRAAGRSNGLPAAAHRQDAVPAGEDLERRLHLLLAARAVTLQELPQQVAARLPEGESFGSDDWRAVEEHPSGGAVPRGLLIAIADAFGVDPDYLLSDDQSVIEHTEHRLHFDSRLRENGIDRLATRSVGPIETQDLEGLAALVVEIVDELRRQ